MLDNIMQLASTNANKQFEVLSEVANNIANMNTTGYKAVRFEQYLTPDGRLQSAERTDYSGGSLQITQRELDVAVSGNGFLPVTQTDGTTAYTRDGSLAVNNKGFLITQRGDLVGSGIQVPTNYEKLLIQPGGNVQVMLKGQQTPKDIGHLSLVRFVNPEGLKNVGYNKVMPTAQSGDALVDADSQLKQGALERANVSTYQQIDQILRLNASLISNMRVIKFTDDIYRQSVNLKQ